MREISTKFQEWLTIGDFTRGAHSCFDTSRLDVAENYFLTQHVTLANRLRSRQRHTILDVVFSWYTWTIFSLTNMGPFGKTDVVVFKFHRPVTFFNPSTTDLTRRVLSSIICKICVLHPVHLSGHLLLWYIRWSNVGMPCSTPFSDWLIWSCLWSDQKVKSTSLGSVIKSNENKPLRASLCVNINTPELMPPLKCTSDKSIFPVRIEKLERRCYEAQAAANASRTRGDLYGHSKWNNRLYNQICTLKDVDCSVITDPMNQNAIVAETFVIIFSKRIKSWPLPFRTSIIPMQPTSFSHIDEEQVLL